MMRKLDLDERKHALSILQRLDKMKQDRKNCDFIVSVDGVEFHTHKNILSAGSDYFNAMLRHDTKERQLGKVEMKDVDSECVGICLDYIYTGKAEIPEGKTEQLIGVATLMQLDKLTNRISRHLMKSLNKNNFYSTRRIADMYDLQGLLSACREFEQENILSLSSQGDFQTEQNPHVVEILTSAPLTEVEKLIVCLQWVGEFEERKSDLIDFLKYIILEEVPENYLHRMLESSPLIKNDLDLYKIFNIPLITKLKSARVVTDNACSARSLILFDKVSNSLRCLNPKTNEVKKFHKAKFTKYGGFSAIALHSYIYILTEDKSAHRLRFLDRKAKWERIQEMIEYHSKRPPSVSLNGFLYVMGGYFSRYTKAAEMFCPSENQWVRLKDMPGKIEEPLLVSLGRSIYCLGSVSEYRSNSLHEFNSQSEEWTELEPMQRHRKPYSGAIALDQTIYVFSSWPGTTIANELDCYNITSKQWTSLSSMIGRYPYVNAHHVCGWIFAVDRFGDSNVIEKYDIENDEWQMVKLKGKSKFRVYDSVLI